MRLVEFIRLSCKHDEDIKSQCSRVMAMAGQCDFRVYCSCQVWVSNKNDMILAQLVAGLADPDG